jgi:hypothetical protein
MAKAVMKQQENLEMILEQLVDHPERVMVKVLAAKKYRLKC